MSGLDYTRYEKIRCNNVKLLSAGPTYITQLLFSVDSY